MSVGESIRYGAKWLLAGNLSGQVLQFAFGVILARLLIPADFGLLVTVQIFTGLAAFVAGGGTGQALVRAKEARLQDFQVVFTMQLVVGLLIYAAFFFSAPLFSHWYKEPLYTELFRISAVSFILRPFVNMPSIWLTREMRFKQRSVVNLVCATLAGVGSVLLALRGFGVWSLVYGGLAGSTLTAIALYAITPVRPGFRFDPALARELGLYGVKFTSNEIVSYIRSQTPNFLLGQLRDPATVGLFNKASSLEKRPAIVAHSVYEPLFRSLAAMQDNPDRSRYLYLQTVMLLAVYMAPLFVLLAWIAHPFIAFVYGPKWAASAQPLAVLSIGGVFACIGIPSGAVLAARNWLGRELFVHLTQAGLYAAGCVVGLKWGLPGVAWGVVLSDVVSITFIALLASRCLRFGIAQFAPSLVPGALLNTLLCLTLLALSLLLPENFSHTRPLLYSFAMFACGGAVYTAAFLFLPIAPLAGEVSRWRKRFRPNLAAR